VSRHFDWLVDQSSY